MTAPRLKLARAASAEVDERLGIFADLLLQEDEAPELKPKIGEDGVSGCTAPPSQPFGWSINLYFQSSMRTAPSVFWAK